ncbi:MAG TPA: diguanylate cyclase [Gallionella sp.]|nr:diguanylate cyclase [Gallionella sp.]
MLKVIYDQLISPTDAGVAACHFDVWHQEALLNPKALLIAILNSSHFMNIATDTKGEIRVFNAGAELMLGYAAAEVINKKTPADLFDRQELLARAQALGNAGMLGFDALVFRAFRGTEDVYELTYIRKDGSRLPAIVSVTALRDAEAAIIGYLLIGTDNTAQKQVEAVQKQLNRNLSDQQFYTRSLIESNIDALMATDPTGIITDVNKQMEAITGCAREELIGSASKSYFTDPERADAGIRQALSEKRICDYELTVRARDGKETVVSYNATTFYNRDGVLQGVFAAARDITERKLAEERIVRLAFHDELTGLPNRRLLTDRLAQAMAASKRSGRYGALMFLDLDNFKTLNDTHGHSVGDLLLIEVARRISSCVREVDFVARFGGDEFVVILGELDMDMTASTRQSNFVAEKIRVALGNPYELKVQLGDKTEKSIGHLCTSSIGMVLFLDHDVGTEEIIKWADTAMYWAKEAGGNSIRIFDY